MYKSIYISLILPAVFAKVVSAGPYTEPGISGYIDLITWHGASPDDDNAVVNPIFQSWAETIWEYSPSDSSWDLTDCPSNDPANALGPATGDICDIVSLGELALDEIVAEVPQGYITFLFGDPCAVEDANHVRNLNGYDFVVFENGLISQSTTSAGSVTGKMFAELAFVEVSSNGIDFARFPALSLTEVAVGRYGTIEVSDVYNLAGKHANGYGKCTGTPFDLAELIGDPLIEAGIVDINEISFIRVVDVPGSGDFLDDATVHIDPGSWPNWQVYQQNHLIYDAWPTVGRGGCDVEAVGILHEQKYSADINLDGIVDERDFALMACAWKSHFGQERWILRCDLSAVSDLEIGYDDLITFAQQWLCIEQWRSEYGD